MSKGIINLGVVSVCRKCVLMADKKKNQSQDVFELNRPLYSGPRWGCSCVAPLSWASLYRNSVCPTPRPTSSSSSTRRTSRARENSANAGKTSGNDIQPRANLPPTSSRHWPHVCAKKGRCCSNVAREDPQRLLLLSFSCCIKS